MKKLLVMLSIGLLVSGCGTMNNALVSKTKNVEYYHVFDIQTDADRHTVAEAASNGLGRNTSSVQEAKPIPSFSEPPEEPGRFKLVNPLEGSNMAALATLASSGGGSLGLKMATCEGAVWTAKANRTISGSSDLRLTACLWQYRGGYHLDTYANFQKDEGGIAQISRNIAHSMVGTPEEWTEKTFLDIVKEIQEITGAEIVHLEGYPEFSGTPWLDDYDV